jgi:quinol monooxygenase YgiN
MPIFQTAHYQVKPEAVGRVKTAIDQFVAYVRDNEPDTRMYVVWQSIDDPTSFVHLVEFADQAAQDRHGQSESVRKFESIYMPELVGGPVRFTDYQQIATNR